MQEIRTGTRGTIETAQGGIAVTVGGGAGAESSQSAVAWTAIIGGALAAIATTLVLMSLGAGLGLTSVSPWPNTGATVTTFGVVAAIWVVVVQWIASGIGGYLTGRLRTKWAAMHHDEVFFRDTAHGFLSWATATLIIVVFLAASAASVVRGTASAVGSVAGGAAATAAQQSGGDTAGGTSMGYLTDTLFRSGSANASAEGQDPRPEAMRIFANAVRNGDLPQADRTYLAQFVAAKAGISQADAEQRVDTAFGQLKDAEAKVRQAADSARKAAASSAIIMAMSLLIGAFVASAAAAFGGNQRDAY